MTKRKKLWIAGGIAALVLAVGGYKGISFWLDARFWEAKMGHGEGKLKPGDEAPDFELQYKKSQETVRLSSFRGDRPVALIFGSYT
jgi:hypothetical protein